MKLDKRKEEESGEKTFIVSGIVLLVLVFLVYCPEILLGLLGLFCIGLPILLLLLALGFGNGEGNRSFFFFWWS